MPTETYAIEVHDVDAETSAFITECEAAYVALHPLQPGQTLHTTTSHITGPGIMFTVTAKVEAI